VYFEISGCQFPYPNSGSASSSWQQGLTPEEVARRELLEEVSGTAADL